MLTRSAFAFRESPASLVEFWETQCGGDFDGTPGVWECLRLPALLGESLGEAVTVGSGVVA
jgi:hypothetical protein